MAHLDVIFNGYASADGVAGTVSVIRDDGLVIVVDPGMVPARSAILDPLAELGVAPGDVTDVVISHHHPDHTMNIALFGEDVRVHDHWATYRRDQWDGRAADGVRLSAGVTLLETPGHTPQDITTLVETEDGVAALTHLWWFEGIEGDPRATDEERLLIERERVAELADTIVPGHGAPFQLG
jgi:glyoxylase-like metal-dependent hydrolase (beta-lactamase superfamily II)